MQHIPPAECLCSVLAAVPSKRFTFAIPLWHVLGVRGEIVQIVRN